MLMATFFRWWYGVGWQKTATSVLRKIAGVGRAFSVSRLLRTLFAPWRRVVTTPGASFNEHLNAWFDNFVGRFVGFFVRFTVLFAASVVMVLTACLGIVTVVIWPVLPPLVIALFIWGVIS